MVLVPFRKIWSSLNIFSIHLFQATIASLQAQVKSGAVDPLLTHELDQLRNIRFVASYHLFFVYSVADPGPDPSDPYVFGPPGPGSNSHRYGSGSSKNFGASV
jgi:hypothetical protein